MFPRNAPEQEILGALAAVSSQALSTTSTENDVAQGNDGEALHDMGHNYYQGIGVEQDFTQAAIYYQAAVDAGQTQRH